MSIKLNPYVNFNGTADKAIKLYESALDAKTQNVMRWGDVPGMDVAPENKNRVMHSELRIGDDLLMLADEPNTKSGAPIESNVQVCLHFTDVDEMQKKFDALAASSKVTMPLNDTFWGARFGMLTDTFGVKWMFNCQLKKP